MFKCHNVELSNIRSVQYHNEKYDADENQSGTEMLGTVLRRRIPEWRCGRHWPRCRCWCPMASTDFLLGEFDIEDAQLPFWGYVTDPPMKKAIRTDHHLLTYPCTEQWTCLACLTSYIFPVAGPLCLSRVMSSFVLSTVSIIANISGPCMLSCLLVLASCLPVFPA